MNYAKKKQEEEEIQRARAEIEEWRVQQWEKLRQLSKTQRNTSANKQDSDPQIPSEAEANKHEDCFPLLHTPPSCEKLEDSKKAKAFAKRKCARE